MVKLQDSKSVSVNWKIKKDEAYPLGSVTPARSERLTHITKHESLRTQLSHLGRTVCPGRQHSAPSN
jgi:hypothetical protein